MTNIDPYVVQEKRAPRCHHSKLNIKPVASTRPGSRNSVAAFKLLTRSRGATIAELAALTGWQPHSVRAHLSGLRKKGVVLLRETRKTGEGSYHVANAGGGDSTSAARKDGPSVEMAGVADTDGTGLAAFTAA